MGSEHTPSTRSRELMLRLSPLSRSNETLSRVTPLLVTALPFDRIDVVADEKLFGDDGTRAGSVTGAFLDDELVGVIASADRFIKLLAVHPDHRRKKIGSELLAYLKIDPALVVRVGDHPGNYLSPGMDVRYEQGIAFFAAHGFIERERVENLRVRYAGNALVTEENAARLGAQAAALGYRVGRPEPAELPGVLAMIEKEFAVVWAKEAAMAARAVRRALFVAFDRAGQPVAFAAADGNNRGLGWFGPAGTLPAHRGKKLGEALLLYCLLAVHGLPEAGVIAWVGPKPFYERAALAGFDRRFTQMVKNPVNSP